MRRWTGRPAPPCPRFLTAVRNDNDGQGNAMVEQCVCRPPLDPCLRRGRLFDSAQGERPHTGRG